MPCRPFLLLLAALLVAPATAQTYPARPVRFVVSSAPGGTQDAVARLIANQLASQMGQQVVIDNRGGGNGVIGCDIVARATPDGYTLLYAATAFAILPSVARSLPFDVERDFIPITRVGVLEGALLLVHPASPAQNLRELIELAKTRSLSYGSPGVGNSLHLVAELLNVTAGTKMVHVPYKGAGPSLNALLAQEIQMVFIPPPVAVPYVKAGRVRALGYSGTRRLGALPDLPTIAEAGLPGFGMDLGWQALFAPAKTPDAIVQRVYAETRRALETPKLREFLQTSGYEPKGETPADFARLFRADLKRYAELARAARIERE
mgnify:CR=1 FL=1